MRKKWAVIIRTQGIDNELELNNAINSVIAQDYENVSIIIPIHTDKEKRIKETLLFLKSFGSLVEIEPIVIKEKQGVRSHPLNVALKKLNSEYVSFLDHDDIYYPWMGSTLITLMEEKKKSFAYGISIKALQERVKDNWGNEYLYTKKKSRFETKNFDLFSFFLDNYIPFNTFVVRTSLIQGECFDEGLHYLEDWDLLRKLALKKDFSLIQTQAPVSEYRVRNDDTDTFNQNNYEKWVESRKRTDRNIAGMEMNISIREIFDYQSKHSKEICHLSDEINRLKLNPAYRAWTFIRDNKYINMTIVRMLRVVRRRLNHR